MWEPKFQRSPIRDVAPAFFKKTFLPFDYANSRIMTITQIRVIKPFIITQIRVITVSHIQIAFLTEIMFQKSCEIRGLYLSSCTNSNEKSALSWQINFLLS